ncbi:MAG: hypothetical protein FWE40_03725 [Oscillospiraceae bacterium]|nr:hypothetical protein [Oscillospiraceae bacterium]
MFSLQITRMYWILDDGNDNPGDLCLHGDVTVRIGDTVLEDDNCCVSAAALFLLRTLTDDHVETCYMPILPYCGHAMWPQEDSDDVFICGCPNGTDFDVQHIGDNVEVIPSHGKPVNLLLEDYRKNVHAFADQVMSYYHASQPKIMPEDDHDRKGYIAFWREFARRRGIALEDTPCPT